MNKMVTICVTNSNGNIFLLFLPLMHNLLAYEKGPSMESAVSFAPLRPAGFVNYMGRAGLGQGLLFAGQGSLFFRGAGQASLQAMTKTEHKI